MADGLIKQHALTRFQPGFFRACYRFYDHFQLAAEHAALIILIAHFKASFWCAQLKLRVGLRHHISNMGLQLFARVPGASRPDNP